MLRAFGLALLACATAAASLKPVVVVPPPTARIAPPPQLSLAVAIMSGARNVSYVCPTLNSVLQHFDPAAVTVFRLDRAAGERADLRACHAAAGVRTVRVANDDAPDKPLRDYAAVVRDAVRRGLDRLLVLEDDVVLEAQFAASLEALLRTAAPAVSAPQPPPIFAGLQLDPLVVTALEALRVQASSATAASPPEPPFIASLYDGMCCDTLGNMTRVAQGVPRPEQLGAAALRRDAWPWGAQAVLFYGSTSLHTPPLLLQLDEYFSDAAVNRAMLQDLFLTQFARERGVPVWGMWGQRRSLVQHVGAQSSLFAVSSRFHWSFYFADGTGDAPRDVPAFLAELRARDAARAPPDRGRHGRAETVGSDLAGALRAEQQLLARRLHRWHWVALVAYACTAAVVLSFLGTWRHGRRWSGRIRKGGSRRGAGLPGWREL